MWSELGSQGQPSATGDLQPLADLLAQHVAGASVYVCVRLCASVVLTTFWTSAGTNPKHICLSELPKNEVALGCLLPFPHLTLTQNCCGDG
jgi:hypothetical protein